MTSLALYTFYEKNGLVHDHVTYYLNGLKEVAQDIVVIVNGLLSENGRRKLEAVGVDILVRENSGFDFAAWKAALERMGQEALARYDEIILCNCSCYGPVYPFSEVFAAMEQRDCDFWGLYRHPAIEGLFPAHLQSYFLVVRKTLFSSQVFFDYWQTLTSATSWKRAVAQETHFTQYFEEKGFTSSAYVESCECGKLFENPTVVLAHKLLADDRFPLVKRKAFTETYDYLFAFGNASQAKETLEFLQTTSFPISHIYQDLLHTMQNSDIRKMLHHSFVLPDENVTLSSDIEDKIAVIVFSYYADLVDEDIAYMQSMPAGSDAYIVVVSDALQEIWEQRKTELPCKNVFIRKQTNRGRNENAYWLTCRDVIEGYDFICVAHDKKTPSAKPPVKGHYFSRHCWDNILKSPDYVRSILDLMQRRPEIGILMPPTPIFGKFSTNILHNEWANNRYVAKEIFNRLKISIPFDEHPDAPWGAMFWLRGKAMAPFYRYNWTIEDFPEEPIPVADGTILHAMERIYPMIAQEAGYFSAWIMPASEAGVHLDNMYHLAKTYSPNNPDPEVHFKPLCRMIKAYWLKKWRKLTKRG